MAGKKNDENNYLYHGTGHELLPFIAKHGLDPEASGGLTWFHKDINESRRYAESPANQMHGPKRKGALLRIALDKIPADAAQHLSYSDITGTTQVVPPHNIEHEQPDGSWEPLAKNPTKAEGGSVDDDGITKPKGAAWSANRIERELNWSHYNDGRAKGHVAFVDPTDFLNATTRNKTVAKEIAEAAGALDQQKLEDAEQSPFLRLRNGKIMDHEGRHRMAALAAAGHTSVPVVLWHDEAQKLTPTDQTTLKAQFPNRPALNVQNAIPLHRDYEPQIHQAMSDDRLKFREGGEVVEGIDVLHSSPHDFDKFKLSKIGTGEGNQMYGHGLYFAQNPAVSGQGGDYWRQFWNKMKSSPEQSAATALHASKFDRDAAIQYLISSQEYHTQHGTPGKYAYDADIEQGHRELADKYRQATEILKAGQIAGPRTYEVKIKAHPDHFLDWDKPISEQSEHVRNVINKLAAEDEKKYGYGGGLHYYTEDPDSHSGESVYQYLKGQHEAPHASKILSKMGIKGIKYLDAMSRNPSPAFDVDYIERQIRKNREEANTANEDDRYYLDQDHEDLLERLEDAKKEKHITRNFVVFDPKHLEVKKKYSTGGPVTNGVVTE